MTDTCLQPGSGSPDDRGIRGSVPPGPAYFGNPGRDGGKVRPVRTFTTHPMEAGIALPIIQKLLGHSNIKTTMIYLHVSDVGLDHIRSPFDDFPHAAKRHEVMEVRYA